MVVVGKPGMAETVAVAVGDIGTGFLAVAPVDGTGGVCRHLCPRGFEYMRLLLGLWDGKSVSMLPRLLLVGVWLFVPAE